LDLAQTTAIKLAFLDLVSATRLARRVERFPTRLLLGGAAILQVYGCLVEYRIEARSVSVRHPSRDERTAATNTFRIPVGVFFGNAGL
jgi:hypothetical protein